MHDNSTHETLCQLLISVGLMKQVGNQSQTPGQGVKGCLWIGACILVLVVTNYSLWCGVAWQMHKE